MNKIMTDTRKQTIEDADRLLGEIADLEIQVVKTTAKFEQRINDLKKECEERVQPLAGLIELKASELAAFIGHNQGLFKKPRARVTAFGKYGMRLVSNTEITDEQAVIDFAKESGYPLYRVTEKVDRAAVKTALDGGVDVPGAKIRQGEESFYKVDKKLLDAARENVLSS